MSNPSLRTGILMVLSGILALSNSACSNNTLSMFSGKSAHAAADSASPNPTVSPTPQPSAAPPPTPPTINKAVAADPYAQAIDIGNGTIKLNELANKRDDWSLIAGRWQEAIELLKTVPATSPDYGKTQVTLNEYQRNLENVKEKITPASPKPCAGDTNPDFFFVPILRKELGTPVIEVTFHDKYKFEMLFDTGATNTLITQQIASTLGIFPVGNEFMEIADGSFILVDTSPVKEIEIDSRVKRNMVVSIGPSKADIGLLGQDFYKGYDILIRENVIEFHRQNSSKAATKTRVDSKACPPADEVKPESFKVPIKSRKNGSIVVEATLNDSNKFDMIFDTGATKTLITQSMAEKLKSPKLGTQKLKLADGSLSTFLITQVKSIEINGRIKRNTLMAVVLDDDKTIDDKTPISERGLLGQDFFQGYDITIKENVIEFTRQRFNE